MQQRVNGKAITQKDEEKGADRLYSALTLEVPDAYARSVKEE